MRRCVGDFSACLMWSLFGHSARECDDSGGMSLSCFSPFLRRFSFVILCTLLQNLWRAAPPVPRRGSLLKASSREVLGSIPITLVGLNVWNIRDFLRRCVNTDKDPLERSPMEDIPHRAYVPYVPVTNNAIIYHIFEAISEKYVL